MAIWAKPNSEQSEEDESSIDWWARNILDEERSESLAASEGIILGKRAFDFKIESGSGLDIANSNPPASREYYSRLATALGDLNVRRPSNYEEVKRYLQEKRLTHFVQQCIQNLEERASEEEIPIDGSAKAEAERILHELRFLPEDTDVYPCEGGKVGIGVLRNPGASFALHCEPGGGALCLVTVDRVSRRARYQDSSRLPDCFVEEGLSDVLRHRA